MDFSYFDNTIEEPQNTPPSSIEAQNNELIDLIRVAQYVPCIHWEYDPSKGGPESNGDQLGFITQALKKVPGLASSVNVDENGIENFDSRFVAGAALSLVAALARVVLGIKLSEDYADDGQTNSGEGMVESIPETNEYGTTTNANYPDTANITSPVVK